MAKLRLKAYIPSATEYAMAWEKYQAFMGAELSEEARKNGAYEGNTALPLTTKGIFFLRSQAGTPTGFCYGLELGIRLGFGKYNDMAGLRIAFNLIYNSESNLVKDCTDEYRLSLVSSHGSCDFRVNSSVDDTESTAPIITLTNGTKCLWLNKDECESGRDKTMQLWTLDIVDRANTFNNGKNSDWGSAVELHDQCAKWIEKNLSEEEKKMIVPVEMSSKDGYEKAAPILEQEKPIKKETEQE